MPTEAGRVPVWAGTPEPRSQPGVRRGSGGPARGVSAPETSEFDRSSVLSLGTALSRLGMVPPTLVRLRSIFVMVSCERHSVGSVPETRLARRRTSSSSFSPLHSSSGTLPERPTSSRMSSLSGAVILLGSVPEMRVFLAEMTCAAGEGGDALA